MSSPPPENPPYGAEPPIVQPSGSSGNRTIIVVIVLAVCGLLFLPCIGVMVGLMLPAVQSAREGARRVSCSTNLKQIGLAIHNYHSVYGSLPPAYTIDEQGQPLHSWRTLILPFMGEEGQAIYEQIDLTRPWDDPVNLRFLDTPPAVYSCPSSSRNDSSYTSYQLIDDPRAIIHGAENRTFTEVTDGLSLTLMVVESTSVDAVPWMKPQDLPLTVFVSSTGRPNHSGGGNVLRADGSVTFLPSGMEPQQVEALVTRAGGEEVAW